MSFEHGLKPGDVIDNNKLVNVFKCGLQGGMRRSRRTNTLVIISDRFKGIYYDRCVGDIIYYTGMGMTGDQSISFAQNKTLAESDKNGVEVHLFEVSKKKEYTYIGQVELAGKPCNDQQQDIKNTLRDVIMFPLKLKDAAPVEDVELSSYSWKIKDKNFAVKVLDKSAFLHRGTGIPINVRRFFIDTPIKSGDRKPIKLLYEDKVYKGHIEIDHQNTPRTRLLWDANFAKAFVTLFPNHFKQYKEGKNVIGSDIIMEYERIDGYDAYKVTFDRPIQQKSIEQDIVSETIENEEGTPQKEGAIKEYFGRRYERDPKNRKRTIDIHGLSCQVCNFNFEETYGMRGMDFIEVHHTRPISSLEGKEQLIDPRTDMITLCSNCHRMIHRRADNVLSVEELKLIYQQKDKDR